MGRNINRIHAFPAVVMLLCLSYANSSQWALPPVLRFTATNEDVQFVNDFVDSLELNGNLDRETLKLHLRFCPTLELCNISTTPIKEHFKDRYNENYTCCSRCQCDRMCYERADCCPDMYQNISKNVQTYKSMRRYRCLPLRITQIPTWRSLEKSAWVIDTCTNRTNPGYIQRCENVQAHFNHETHVSVTNSDDRQIYRNIFCARCNNVEDEKIIGWDVRVSCSSPGRKVISPPNFENYAQEGCFLEMESPVEINETEKCATTGYLISPYDSEELDSLCSLYQSPFMYQHRNVHCAFAKRRESTPYTCRKDIHYVPIPFNGYSFMLDFQTLRTWNTGRQTPDRGDVMATESNCSSENIFVPSQVSITIKLPVIISNHVPHKRIV